MFWEGPRWKSLEQIEYTRTAETAGVEQSWDSVGQTSSKNFPANFISSIIFTAHCDKRPVGQPILENLNSFTDFLKYRDPEELE